MTTDTRYAIYTRQLPDLVEQIVYQESGAFLELRLDTDALIRMLPKGHRPPGKRQTSAAVVNRKASALTGLI